MVSKLEQHLRTLSQEETYAYMADFGKRSRGRFRFWYVACFVLAALAPLVTILFLDQMYHPLGMLISGLFCLMAGLGMFGAWSNTRFLERNVPRQYW